ncbi:MAG: hypothetical protein ACRCUS_02400 [Anaerovoracaceae bacterium]
MNILFVGTEIDGNFIVEKCSKAEVEFFESQNLRHSFNLILDSSPKHLIINISYIIQQDEELLKIIESIKNAVNSRIIIFAPGYSREMKVIGDLFNAGVKNFILAGMPTPQKEALVKCLSGEYDNLANGSFTETVIPAADLSPPAPPPPPEPEAPILYTPIPEKELPPKPKSNPFIMESNYKEVRERDLTKMNFPLYSKKPSSIAISGATGRIGTTTACFQMIKYLLKERKKPCYIEMNDTNYLQNLVELYDEGIEMHNKELGYIRYLSVDMYYKKEQIPEILKKGYDYFIYDYGVVSSADFSLVSFLEKDKVIVVCGTKPNEIEFMRKVIDNFYAYPEPYYLFNFVPASEQAEILELMKEKKYKTSFLEFSPEPFTYNSKNDISNSMILA